MIVGRLLVFAALTVVAAGCGGDREADVDDVRAAFKAQGLSIQPHPNMNTSATAFRGVKIFTDTASGVVVYVFDNRPAAARFENELAFSDGDGQDLERFGCRVLWKGLVATYFCQAGEVRKSVRRALATLPSA